jgi:hypothetical protein
MPAPLGEQGWLEGAESCASSLPSLSLDAQGFTLPSAGDLDMTHQNSLYNRCQDTFADYPAAVSSVDDTCTASSIILMLRVGGDDRFFMLTCDRSESRPVFYIRPWHGRGTVGIKADGKGIIPDILAEALISGIPIPRDGSMFAWRHGTEVTALIAIYAKYTPSHPQPSWAVMPRADISRALWPPFTGERIFGNWFWEHLRDERIFSLEELITDNPGTVFWVDIEFALSHGCCAVAQSIVAENGYILRSGCYAYYEELKVGSHLPTLDALMADSGRIDLAPRFGVIAHGQSGSERCSDGVKAGYPRGPRHG